MLVFTGTILIEQALGPATLRRAFGCAWLWPRARSSEVPFINQPTVGCTGMADAGREGMNNRTMQVATLAFVLVRAIAVAALLILGYLA